MKTIHFLRALALVLTLTTALHSQVPQILNYQGRVTVGNPPVNFDGSGQFKFALVQGEGPTLLWKNDGSAGNTEPAAAVTLPVTKGLYSVLLGANMTPIPATVFANPDVRLRVWFNNGTNGSQLLSPDQRIAAVGYAMVAEKLANQPYFTFGSRGDDTDSGLLAQPQLSFNKKSDSSRLRITYTDNIRVTGTGASYATWQLRIDGQPAQPQLAASLYETSPSYTHLPMTITGIVPGVPAGSHTLSVHIINPGGYNAYTGWGTPNMTTYYLEVEEL